MSTHVDIILIQCLTLCLDVEETVVARVFSSLASLCELGLFQKMRIWELLSATLAFLYHPNNWIRQGESAHEGEAVVTEFHIGAAAFIAASAKHLPPSDVWCILYPSLKHFLRSDIRDVDERSLLIALKPAVSLTQPFLLTASPICWALAGSQGLRRRESLGQALRQVPVLEISQACEDGIAES